MQLETLRVFIKTVECGSFSAAARALQRATSSVSRRIEALEDDLKVRLFRRSTHSLSLTEAGEAYFLRVRKVLQELDTAEEDLHSTQTQPRGRLRISSTLGFGQCRIMPLLPEFMRLYPDLQVDMDFTDRVVDLVKEEIDIAVRIGNLPDSSLIARRLAKTRFVLCASHDYLAQHEAPQSPEDLSAHQCLRFTLPKQTDKWYWTQAGAGWHTVHIHGAVLTNSEALLRTMALSGAGVALVPDWLIQDDIQQERLQVLLPEYELSIEPHQDTYVYALYTERQFVAPKIRVFIDFLSSQLELHD